MTYVFVGDRIRQLCQTERVNSNVIGVGRLAQKRNPVADLEPMLDFVSNLYNLTSTLTTRDKRDRGRVCAGSLIDVKVIDTGEGHLDEDLSWVGGGTGNRGEGQDRGWAAGFDSDDSGCCVDHFLLLLFGGRRRRVECVLECC